MKELSQSYCSPCMHMYICIYIYNTECISTCTNAHAHTHTCAQPHTHVHTHTHAHTHTHTHTQGYIMLRLPYNKLYHKLTALDNKVLRMCAAFGRSEGAPARAGTLQIHCLYGTRSCRHTGWKEGGKELKWLPHVMVIVYTLVQNCIQKEHNAIKK